MKIDKTRLLKTLNPAKTVLILSPDNPDHDSVSSNVALAETFKQMGKRVVLLANTPIPEELVWILGGWQYLTKAELVSKPPKPDLTVITDIGGMSQVKMAIEGQEGLIQDTPTLLIDHHATRDAFKFTAAVVDPEAAATGELLYHLYQKLGWQITPKIARYMLIGILGDTTSFQNQNVDVEVLKVAAALVDLGADIYAINQEYLQAAAFTPEKFYTLMELGSQAKFEGLMAYGLIPYKKVAKFGPNAGFTHALGSQIRFLKDIKVSFVLSERADGSLRLSMRSQPGIDVSKVTAHFGGGGHRVAAGAVITGKSLDQAAKKVVALLKQQVK